jgi:hypothetical protein
MAGGLPIAPVAGGLAFCSRRQSAFRSHRRWPSSQARWPSSPTWRPDPLLPDPAARHLILHEIPAFDHPCRFPSLSGTGSCRGGTVRRWRRRIRPRWHRPAAEVLDPAAVAPCDGGGPPSSRCLLFPAAPPSSSRPGGAPSTVGSGPRWRWRPNSLSLSLSLSSSCVWWRVVAVAAVRWWWLWSGGEEAARGGGSGSGGMVVVVDRWGQSRGGPSGDGGINFLLSL